MTNSIVNLAGHVLAPPTAARLRRLLDELVNTPDGPGLRKFATRFPDFLREVPRTMIREWKVRIYEDDAAELSDEEFFWRDWLPGLRDSVRAVWKSSDHRFKQWGVFRILEKYFGVGDRSLSTGPVYDDVDWISVALRPAIPFEMALTRLLKTPHLTRFCANPECEAPYFWAAHASQRYCSEPCSRTAQQQSKRIWWAEHGKEWRRKQVAKRTRPRRKSRSKKSRQGKGR